MQTQPTTKTKHSGWVASSLLCLSLLLCTNAVLAGSSYYTACQFGSVAISSSGGTGSWTHFPGNPGNSFILNAGSDTTTVTSFTNAGVYAYIWTGSNIDTAYVTVNAVPVANAGSDQTICIGTTVAIGSNPTATGGSGSYQYMWSPATGLSSATVSNPVISPLAATTYTVTVVDAVSGCSATDNVTISISAVPQITMTTSPVSCYGGTDGSLCANVTGGTAPYTYIWNSIPATTASCANGLAYGTYTITVTSSNGCTAADAGIVSQPASALSISDTVVNISCYGGGDGQIYVTATGGTPPYMYNWSNGSIQPTVLPLPAGPYTLTVTDAGGCTATLTRTITEPTLVSLAVVSVTDASCYGSNDGSACVAANGGAGGYAYTWAPAMITTPCMNGAPAGTYAVSVTDMNGCSASTAVSITQPATLTLVLQSLDVSCFGGNDGSALAFVTGGTTPYSYQWSGAASSTNTASSLAAGYYYVFVTDNAGCQMTDSILVTEPSPLSSNPAVTNTSCGASDGIVCINASGGTQPYYTDLNGTRYVTNCISNLTPGSYLMTLTDANGCTENIAATVIDGAGCVWPGDADANLLVDNNDLLPIGLGYDSTGPARTVTSIVWQGSTASDWSQSFSSYTPVLNYKYADCNGDGVIDATDTTAITQNFGLTHSKTINRKPWRSGDPVIYPLLSKDTVTNGDTLTVDIHLGDVSLTATNVYGLAYTINYDPAVLDTTKTTFEYGSSWLGSAADMISISKDLRAQGMVKTAVTRIDHTTRSGSGVIAQMRAIVTTDNIDGKDLSYYPVQIIISDVRAIDQQGSVLQVNEGADSTDVAYTPLGVRDVDAGADISMYPNPANSLLHITSSHTVAQSAEVINTLGEVVSSYAWGDTHTDHTADLSSLPAGIYYIRLHTRAGVAVRKFSVAH